MNEVRAELVANVLSVHVSTGSRVVLGDVLVVLDSMKMEIPVLADAEGTVTKLEVARGSVVQAGDLIAVIQ